MSDARPSSPKQARQYERVLARLRKICLALPDTSEVVAWGHPTFRVGKKIFVGFGIEDGRITIGFKTDGPEQQELVETRPDLYYVAKYVGKHGWVSAIADGKLDWDEVERHVVGSYKLIAGPKKSAKLK